MSNIERALFRSIQTCNSTIKLDPDRIGGPHIHIHPHIEKRTSSIRRSINKARTRMDKNKKKKDNETKENVAVWRIREQRVRSKKKMTRSSELELGRVRSGFDWHARVRKNMCVSGARAMRFLARLPSGVLDQSASSTFLSQLAPSFFSLAFSIRSSPCRGNISIGLKAPAQRRSPKAPIDYKRERGKEQSRRG